MDTIEFGICRLALVPVRTAGGNANEQISQLLFGEQYEVLASDKSWLHIRITQDQSEGWIEAGHHHAIAREYYDQINHADFKITTDVTATLLYKKSALTILMGSIVPISTSELFKMEEQLAFNGESKSLGLKRDGEFAKSIALKYINAPALAGGRSPFGIDAPGLVQMVCKISGYTVPRNLSRLAGVGRHVEDITATKCGDLAFFGEESSPVTHCGIILDDDKIIHPFGRVRVDHINEEGIINPETRIYTHHLLELRRVFVE